MSAPTTFLITGGSGLVGRRLTELLLAQGHEVKHLSRTTKSGGQVDSFLYSVEDDHVDPKALEGVDVVVHLAGAGIADARWTAARKKELLDSRVETLNLLKRHIVAGSQSVSTLISASAQGYYPPNRSTILHEDDAADGGWMGQLCVAWEEAAATWRELGIRVVVNRIGLVLSPGGGVLEALMRPIEKRLSPVFGSGSQIYSWIHIDDLCRLFMFEAETAEMRGVFNAVAPFPVSQREFSAAISGRLSGQVLPLPAPRFLLKAALGERAAVVVDSYNVSSDKVRAAGYEFEYATLRKAMSALLPSDEA